MMELFRGFLPRALMILGVICAVLFAFFAALGATDNPLQFVMLLFPGIGFGMLLCAAGLMLDDSAAKRENDRQMLAMAKAQTHYMKALGSSRSDLG